MSNAVAAVPSREACAFAKALARCGRQVKEAMLRIMLGGGWIPNWCYLACGRFKKFRMTLQMTRAEKVILHD